ncbi:Homeobox-leucine zipper protein ROC8 [Capsicum annuum]|uniref:Homeobox-leucine zipper protein ROC8 n=1 Tax=Capsicum annuum TaxID=4072 RepID=A0A1U8H3X4_CAPAN|nr:homeobox-leucine zipper protein ROC8 [Capsicum annuum]KAF3680027.1 Homeobox-leucine zipper protein ROC8 [Capsicum annuum]KAF3682159.1 Homeobox-leucine zipper protein ROC8 [Capsicum annuum]PHT79831.1 Homeobox-leucine zipper protein ROC8 [Capsicum annuum]
MEYGSTGGGAASSSGGGDAADAQRKKKCFHRHTAHQIQSLEAVFKECPHPDEKTRLQLSRDLGLAPRQIKFWFQNRRTQLKSQHERADNSALRSENDRIRCENIAMREAIKNVICPSCGGPPVEHTYFDEQKLRMENLQLKEELDKISSIAAKYMGRPIAQLPPVQPVHLSSLNLMSMSNFGLPGPSLDLDLLPGSSTSTVPSLTFPTLNISDMDKSLMADIAGNAMEELIRLLQTNEPLWTKSTTDGRHVLNVDTYDQIFPKANSSLKNPNVRVEASRESGVVIMNGLALVDMFIDVNKWAEFFPTIVSKAGTLEVISCGIMDSRSSTLQLMYEEQQVLSPLVPTRHLYFLRFCQQIEPGSWAIVDVSYDITQENLYPPSSCKVHKLPSGCLIQDMPNGYSKVTWLEHVEVEEKGSIHRLYRDLIHSGMAFGAERWLGSLQRMCERDACLMVSGNSSRELGGVIPSPEGKKSMMKVSQRMVSSFCASINPSNGHQWNNISTTNEFEVRATLQKCTDPGQPNGVVISAASTIWLPVPPQHVFNFLRDERTRSQWDVLSNQNPVQEVAHIANGSHPGNSISVLRAYNTSQNNMLILQESCIDSSGSLVVYSPVDLQSINIAMSGEDTTYIPLLPSGFTILRDGRHDGGSNEASMNNNNDTMGEHNRTGGGRGGGSLVTVAFQILVSSLSSSAKMSPESVNTVNNLIGNTIHQIKAALNCSNFEFNSAAALNTEYR